MNKEIQHEVSEMVGLVQSCTRCGIIICDYRGAMIEIGKEENVGGFAAGPIYINGNRISAFPDSPYFNACEPARPS